jgi:hypothetical protein
VITLLCIVLASWLLSVAASLSALFLILGDHVRRPGLCLALSSVALAIGYLGFGDWSPFHFFPQVGWMYSSGDFHIHIASSWFFVVPLVLGGVAMTLAIRRKMAS